MPSLKYPPVTISTLTITINVTNRNRINYCITSPVPTLNLLSNQMRAIPND